MLSSQRTLADVIRRGERPHRRDFGRSQRHVGGAEGGSVPAAGMGSAASQSERRERRAEEFRHHADGTLALSR